MPSGMGNKKLFIGAIENRQRENFKGFSMGAGN
jgi:hypothetical protein